MVRAVNATHAKGDDLSALGMQNPVFVTTRWSVVLTAGKQEETQAQAALEQLCRAYWYPLYVYVRRRGYKPEDAQDLTQDFFAWLLARNWIGRADQERGRFRSFLLTTLHRFLANEWDKRQAQKRGGGRVVPLDDAEARFQYEPAELVTPEQCFERRWCLALLASVLEQLGQEHARAGRVEQFNALKPCLLGERPDQPYAALAAELRMTEGSVKVLVHRLRQRYRALLREAIAHTVARPEEIDDEMRHLCAVLARQ